MKTETHLIEIFDEVIIQTELLFASNNTLLALTQTGKIYQVDLQSKEQKFLFQLPDIFDLTKAIEFHIHQQYLCIVEEKGLHGIVINLENPKYSKPLERADYHSDHCSYPIAFYEQNRLTYLIHATDWNRLDITCLETDKLLTDRKVDYEEDANYLDYFHSSLLISPNGQYFLSNGWVWQPYDLITIFETKRFLEEYDPSAAFLDAGDTSGYNWDRPVCWIDNQYLAVPYGIAPSEDDDVNQDSPIHLFIVDATKNEIVEQFPLEGFYKNDYGEIFGSLHFDKNRKLFIGICISNGLFVIDRHGKAILSEPILKHYSYEALNQRFYKFDKENNTLIIKYLFH